jgi:hypothetical protein
MRSIGATASERRRLAAFLNVTVPANRVGAAVKHAFAKSMSPEKQCSTVARHAVRVGIDVVVRVTVGSPAFVQRRAINVRGERPPRRDPVRAVR